mgnify:CR=1 FL=1
MDVSPATRQDPIERGERKVGHARRQVRRQEIAATVADYEPMIAQEQAAIAALPPTLKLALGPILMERLNKKRYILVAAKRNRDITSADLLKQLDEADKITLPVGRGVGVGGGSNSDLLDTMTGRGAPSASEQRMTRKDAIEELRAEKLATNPGDTSQPTEAEIQRKMRTITGSMVPDFRNPKSDSIIPGPAPDGDVRKQFEEAKAAGADRATLAGILKANGIDPSTPIQDAQAAQAKTFEKMIAEMSDAEKEQFLRFKAKGAKTAGEIPFGEYAKLQEKNRRK